MDQQPTFLQQVARQLCDHFAEQIVVNRGPIAALQSTTGLMRQAVKRYIDSEEARRAGMQGGAR